jgi:hypothetical protein
LPSRDAPASATLAGGALRSARLRRANPDKVMTQPYLGREAVSFSSILRDEWTGPRRCGRIAGCRALKTYPRARVPGYSRPAKALKGSPPLSSD